jgi:hypothetical protein
VCEGKNTEPEYFEALASLPEVATIEIVPLPGSGDPSNIVRVADRIRRGQDRLNSFEKNDEVWAVFDRDEHPHFDAAKQACQGKKIGLAFSNPCFELWLLLHFTCHNSPDDRHTLQKKLERLDPKYSSTKGKLCDFAALCANVETAEKHADQLLKWRLEEGAVGAAPTTTVHTLTRKLRGRGD